MAKKQQQIDALKQEIAELKKRIEALEFGRWFPLNPALTRDAESKTDPSLGDAINNAKEGDVIYWPPQQFTGEG